MIIGARIESVEALLSVKIALAKFAEQISSTLDEVDAEIQRTILWLDTEQIAYWELQQRKRAEQVVFAKEALRSKTLFRGIGGRRPSAVDEQKALALAVRRQEEAEQKIAAVKRWIPRLQKELAAYHGGVQRLATSVKVDVPAAMAQLDAMIGSLVAYLKLKGPQASDAGAPSAEAEASSEGEPPESPPGPAN